MLARVRKRAIDEIDLMRSRRIVGIDQSRLEVPVPHPLLKRPHRHASRGHPGTEGVPEIVKAAGNPARFLSLSQPCFMSVTCCVGSDGRGDP